MDISVVICAYNEEEFLPDLFTSISGIEDIVFIDHQSTDGTAKLAKELGARVYVLPNNYDWPIPEDILNFKDRYGFKPNFNLDTDCYNGTEDRNDGIKLAKNDWVFCIDCDEIVTWDLPAIKKMLPLCNQIEYLFVHTHDTEGNPAIKFYHSKLFNRTESKWIGRVHEVVIGDHPRIIKTDKMRLDHWQKPRVARGGYLSSMEFAVIRDDDLRTKYYLAREYYYRKEYEKAIQF